MLGLYRGSAVKLTMPVQRILRKEAPSVPPVPCPRHRWNAFEALAPHVIWAMDICYLYTNQQDGFDRYLIILYAALDKTFFCALVELVSGASRTETAWNG
jgi:hypothetical protein